MSLTRGQVVWVDLGAGKGSEQNKRRPAVVVSNDGANAAASRLGQGVVTLVPLTSGARKPFPFQVAVSSLHSGLATDSTAQAEQVRSVDIQRITPTRTVLPQSVMGEINEALQLHLELW